MLNRTMENDPLIAGVELGGTKAVAILARGPRILTRTRIATTLPHETLGALRRQLEVWRKVEGFAALGIASFGPVRVNRDAADYGCLLDTPKPGWSGARITEVLSCGLDCPWQIDTDVNAAALAEWRWGAAQGLSTVCYLTLGTGVGGGLLVDGRPLHGALHPEIGHLRLRRSRGDQFEGVCPFHADCVEGLISGPALHARFGSEAEQVAADDSRWDFVAHDLAGLIAAIILTTSAEKVLLGGGVGLGRSHLLGRVRQLVVDELSSYLPHITSASAQKLIALAALAEDAGPLGAVALGQAALQHYRSDTRPAGRQK